MDINEEKSKIRKEVKKRRAELSSSVLTEIENLLPDFILGIEDEELTAVLGKAKRIALYRSVRGEVPVDRLAEVLMATGKKCCFPRVVDDAMIFCDCESLSEQEFEISSYGIKEPVASKSPVDPAGIDVVVLPAVAYNEEGTRLGMGGGFYDRYIGAYGGKRPYLLGICYEFQICSDVPSNEQDIAADFVAVIPEEIYGE